MKKLNFVLKSNNLEIINKDCEYYNDENSLSFKYDNLKLTLKREKDIVFFIRESETDYLELSNDKGKLKCIVKILDPIYEMEIKTDKFECKFKDGKITVDYMIESDEGIEKSIILSLNK